MSVDYRLLFVYTGSIIVMAVAGENRLSMSNLLLATGLLVVVLIAISIRYRKQKNWYWPGATARNIFHTGLTFVLAALLLFAATPQFLPLSGAGLPWYLAGLGIGTFSVLNALRVVYISQAEFLTHCYFVDPSGQQIALFSQLPEAESRADSSWKKLTQRGFQTLFLLAWVGVVGFFYYDGTTLKNGSPAPTATRTERLDNHGIAVFVTPAEKERLDQLQLALGAGLSAILSCGAVLHFLAGVKIFTGVPTLRELLDRRNLRP